MHKNKYNQIFRVALIILLGLILINNFIRDLDLAQQAVGDLRNRIVGARIQKDGSSPYFYKWKHGDGMRYYDIENETDLKMSNGTASPFFHFLLYPIAEIPYENLCKFWVFILYGLLMLCALLSTKLSPKKSKLVPWAIATAFTFTETWLDTIVTKQMYLFIPVFAFTVYFLLIKANGRKTIFFLAGLFSVFLVLIKPTALLILLPLVFIQKYSPLDIKLSFLLPALLGLVFTFSSFQRKLWYDYFENGREQVKMHQGLGPEFQLTDNASFTEIEGVSLKKTSVAKFKYTPYVEHGNFFVMIELLFGYKISVTMLFVLFCLNVLAVLVLFYCAGDNTKFGLENLFLLGYCLYLLSDLYAPIHRGQYNTVLWLFPLMLVPVTYHKKYIWLYVGVFIAFVMNLHFKPVLPMQHTLGEYVWLLLFLIYAFVLRTPKKQLEPNII